MPYRRSRKSSVSPGLRRQWLRRVEENGESPPQIADSNGWDVRTVRKQVELARQDQELRDAKHVVFRQALERHYADLCSFAQKLDNKISQEFSHISLPLEEQRLLQALQQHLPKSPMWKQLDEWYELVIRLQSSMTGVRRRITEEMENRPPLDSINSEDSRVRLEGFLGSLLFHLEALAKGWRGLEDQQYVDSSMGEGWTQIQYGAFSWIVPDKMIGDVKRLHRELMAEGTSWQEYGEMRDCYQELYRLRDSLRDQLAVVILRRIVPGRCLYCPF